MNELLVVAVLVLSASNAVLLATVPVLCWRQLRAERRIETLDEAISDYLRAAGVPEHAEEKPR